MSGNIRLRKRGAVCGGEEDKAHRPGPLSTPDLTETVQTVFPLTSLETASVRKKTKKTNEKGGRGVRENFMPIPVSA